MTRLIAPTLLLFAMSTSFVFSQPNDNNPPQMADADKARLDNMKTAAGLGLGFIVCIGVVTFFIELIPVGIALVRGHPDTVAIALVSILFGWTCIGFAVALIWAVKSFPRNRLGEARDY